MREQRTLEIDAGGAFSSGSQSIFCVDSFEKASLKDGIGRQMPIEYISCDIVESAGDSEGREETAVIAIQQDI